MAYQETFSQDDEDKKKEQLGATSSEQVLGGATSGSADMGDSNAAPSTAKPQSRSGAWTNLTSYIDANKDQAAGMAGKVTSNIDSNLGKANQSGQSYADTTNQQIDQNTVKDDGTIGAIQKTPGQVTADQWKNVTRDYQGPTTANGTQGYADVTKQYADVDKSVDSLGNAQGRQQTVADTFKRPEGYTQGENTLDSFLLGAGEGGKALSGYQDQYKASNPQAGWGGLLSGIDSNINQAKATSANTKATAQNAMDTGITSGQTKYTGAQNQATDANKQIDANIAKIQNDLRSSDPATRAAAYANYGLNQQQGEALRTQDPNLGMLGLNATYNQAGDFAGDLDLDALNNLLTLSGKGSLAALGKSTGAGISSANADAYRTSADGILGQQAKDAALAKAQEEEQYTGLGPADAPARVGTLAIPSVGGLQRPMALPKTGGPSVVSTNDEINSNFQNPTTNLGGTSNGDAGSGATSTGSSLNPDNAAWLSRLLNSGLFS